MTLDIYRCRFCGSECAGVMGGDTISTITLYYVVCYDCEAHGPVAHSEELAERMWNGVWD